MAAGQLDASDKNTIMLALDVEPVTATDEGFWNWVENQLDATLGKKPLNIAPAAAGPPQMNAAFWESITKMLGTSIVALQDQHPQQHQPGPTQSVHIGRRDNYNDYVLVALMGYANIFNTSDIPMIWGKFQQSKELADNRQELKKGMVCWERMKLITIEKAILFIKLTVEDMIKLRFTPGGSVAVFEKQRMA